MTSSKQGKKLNDELIALLKILSANRIPYATITLLTGVSAGTISKYCSQVAKLPKSMCKNPFSLLTEDESEKIFKARLPTPQNLKEAGLLEDIDYFIENHVEGTRFTGPLDKIGLSELIEVMGIPTNYKSPLSMGEWAKYYLEGKEGSFLLHYPHKFSKLQMEMFQSWTDNKRLMIETFRDAGKTMVADAILLHEICENRDSNYFIMSETKTKAGFRVKHIGDMLLSNKRIIADYGFLPHDKKYGGTRQSWKRDEFTVKRDFKQTDPTLMAFSTESPAATGAHFAGGVFDDVWSFNLERNSFRNKEKFFGWFYSELEGCFENAWELWLLTRKGVTDLYQDLEDSQFYVVYKKPAIIKYPSKYKTVYKMVGDQKVYSHIQASKDGKITDDGNGRFTMEFFLEKKAKMPANDFESEYQLDPRAATGVYWKKKNLRWFSGWRQLFAELKVKNALSHLQIIGFMDFGFGKKSRADFTALTIVGIFDGKYYFLELFLKRGATENQMVQMMLDACRLFPQLRTIYCESDLQQSDKVDRLKEKARFVSIRPFLSRQEQKRLEKEDSARRVNLEGKPLRIWCQLEGIIEDNILYVNKFLRNFKEFMDEFITFPACEHFDVLDALGNCCSIQRKKAVLIFGLSG